MENLDLQYKIHIPFAQNGDKDDIPDTSTEGLVNNTDGLGVKYETPIAEGGEYFERQAFNGILYKVYAAVKELQDLAVAAGFPVDMTKAINKLGLSNGGTGGNDLATAQRNLHINDLVRTLYPTQDLNKSGQGILISWANNLTNAPKDLIDSGVVIVKTDLNYNLNSFDGTGAYDYNIQEYISRSSFAYAKRVCSPNRVIGEWKKLRNDDGSIPSDLSNLPIGFIYLQLRGQSTPDMLFGTSGKWQDVSNLYAGEFFRANGGNSSSFGTVQQEGLPNITGQFNTSNVGILGDSTGALQTSDFGQWEINYTYITNTRNSKVTFNASQSNGIYGASSHVTPYNSSVRVWKKIA